MIRAMPPLLSFADRAVARLRRVAVLAAGAFLAAVPVATGFQARVERLPQPVRTMLTQGGFWHAGCPVPLSDLRLVTVTHRGFDRRDHDGQLIVNRHAAGPMVRAFRDLHALGFPIRHMALADMYGPPASRPADGDVSGSFECRQAVPSPCTGGSGTGHWSNHAYGLAIDLNPRENPYVGCGRSRDPAVRPYFNRTLVRRGMVTSSTVRAFASVGWGWGGAWTGATKDYMHFSHNGH